MEVKTKSSSNNGSNGEEYYKAKDDFLFGGHGFGSDIGNEFVVADDSLSVLTVLKGVHEEIYN